MMVDVFIHPGTPLVRRQWAEERMRMFRALRFPALVKLPDTNLELFLFASYLARKQ